MQLILASNNAKKLAELSALFAPLGFALLAQPQLSIDEAAEPYPSFIENALAKARHAARYTGGAAIADDSGLCVDALGGAPGVRSARYADVVLPAGEREVRRCAQDAANNRLLLERLGGVAERGASYVSVLVALRSAADPEPLVAVGRWPGKVLETPRGSGGFGYDPLMQIETLGCSVAELAPAVKDKHSHRAIAAQRMLALMREAWRPG